MLRNLGTFDPIPYDHWMYKSLFQPLYLKTHRWLRAIEGGAGFDEASVLRHSDKCFNQFYVQTWWH